MTDTDPVTDLWCRLYEFWVDHGKPSSRDIARAANKSLVDNEIARRVFSEAPPLTHSRVNNARRVAEAVYRYRHRGHTIGAEHRATAADPPPRRALLTMVFALDPGAYDMFEQMWRTAAKWHGTPSTAPFVDAPAPESSHVEDSPLVDDLLTALRPEGGPMPKPRPAAPPQPLRPPQAFPSPQPQPEPEPEPGTPDGAAVPPDLQAAVDLALRRVKAGVGEGEPAPSRYLVGLGPEEHPGGNAAAFTARLAAEITARAAALGLPMVAPVVVKLVEDDGLQPGVYQIIPDDAPPEPQPPETPPPGALPQSDRRAGTGAEVQGKPVVPDHRGFVEIGRGGTSVVYRAMHIRLPRVDAVKIFLDAAPSSASYLRELHTSVALADHPHIVTVYDAGVDGLGRPYLVMRYCPDGAYDTVLAARGPLPVAEVVEVGTAIAGALDAVHRAGYIHRDVKPSNILRTSHGPLLADFGIARSPRDLSLTASIDMMTPNHASPEALSRGAQSASSDVYSLASTLWHLLTGWPPFQPPDRRTTDLGELRRRVLTEPVPQLPRPDVPAPLERELVRALAKAPAQRHPTAAAFGDALRRRWDS